MQFCRFTYCYSSSLFGDLGLIHIYLVSILACLVKLAIEYVGQKVDLGHVKTFSHLQMIEQTIGSLNYVFTDEHGNRNQNGALKCGTKMKNQMCVSVCVCACVTRKVLPQVLFCFYFCF